ncbi:MAG: DNA alkylation repair protein [Coriobacteriales bacterium]|nr:DNA alkylation repair protein [Coriobacteriales bacterium]
MIVDDIREELFSLQDTGYREFQTKLAPTIDPASIIGVRTPALRKMAKRLAKADGIDAFLSDLPHAYFDENQLHAFIVSQIRDFTECLEAVDRFLPYVDNWATCDQMSPQVFKKHHSELLEPIRRWIASDATFTIRFGVGMLMEHFLGEDFDSAYMDMIATVRSEEYYVRMMVAWYFATALAKQSDAALPYLEERRLDPWIHNKTIQKAVESRRISPEQKEYLRGLRIRAS